ncbi:hypothetical protein RJT34_11668 [Clitoria ternatea]|uniref:Tyrosine--tRNA ligase n=1 Tax=Clitoria ternatea TaxID=43366 RepID=A0AAN9JMY6_CLITE
MFRLKRKDEETKDSASFEIKGDRTHTQIASSICAPTRTLLFTHSTKLFKPFPDSFSLQFTKTTCTLQQQQPRPNIIQILKQRGLVESITSNTLKTSSSSFSLKVYCGFDPTVESLHLGNLLGIIVLSWFHRCGHRAVALIGGATTRVGDPSGKSLERPELDADNLEKNILGIS